LDLGIVTIDLVNFMLTDPTSNLVLDDKQWPFFVCIQPTRCGFPASASRVEPERSVEDTGYATLMRRISNIMI